MSDLRLGVLGHPVSHSLSPRLHQIFLEQAHLCGAYEAVDVSPENLGNWMARDAHTYTGFNVTLPHKVAMLAYVDRVSSAARAVGAVNTVLVRGQELHGENTDVAGFMAPLPPDCFARWSRQGAVIVGAGGASRAVAYGLLSHGIHRLTFWVRDLQKAAPVMATIKQMAHSLALSSEAIMAVQTVPLESWASAGLVVNTTPVGMSPHIEVSPMPLSMLAQLDPQTLVYDLVYNPLETRLIQEARAFGLATQDGLDMLIYQGAASFALWTGHHVSHETVLKAKALLMASLNPPGA